MTTLTTEEDTGKITVKESNKTEKELEKDLKDNQVAIVFENNDTQYVTAKIITPGTARETLVGFENHSGLTYLQGETKPLAKILTGNGNNGKDKTEGARFKNIFGTYLHGSLLPKNPHFADLLITLALEKRYNDRIELQKLDDDIELAAHNSLVNKKY